MRILLWVTIALAASCGAGDEEPPPRDGAVETPRVPAATTPEEPARTCGESLFGCEIAMASHPGVECENPLATTYVSCKLHTGFGPDGVCRVPCTMMSTAECDRCIEGSCTVLGGTTRCTNGACAAAFAACLNDR